MNSKTYAAQIDGVWYYGLVDTNYRIKFVEDKPIPAVVASVEDSADVKLPPAFPSAIPRPPPARPVPQAVTNFFQAMQANDGQLQQAMNTLLELDAAGLTPETVYVNTIEDSISLAIEEEIVWTAEEAGVAALADALEAAGGDALLALGVVLVESVEEKAKIEHFQQAKKEGKLASAIKAAQANAISRNAMFAGPPPDGEYIINFKNLSGQDWTLLSYWSPTHNAIDKEIKAPEQTLKGKNGYFGTSQLDFKTGFRGAGNGPWDAWVQYKSPEGVIVGTQIHQPFELLWMGYEPYYQVCYSGGNGWMDGPGKSKSFSWTGFGYKFEVSPTAGGSSYQCDCTISKA